MKLIGGSIVVFIAATAPTFTLPNVLAAIAQSVAVTDAILAQSAALSLPGIVDEPTDAANSDVAAYDAQSAVPLLGQADPDGDFRDSIPFDLGTRALPEMEINPVPDVGSDARLGDASNSFANPSTSSQGSPLPSLLGGTPQSGSDPSAPDWDGRFDRTGCRDQRCFPATD